MTFKQQILQHHKILLQDKIDAFQDMISGLTFDAQNDAKGSAGDKHETALSMMHLEQEKLNFKLREFLLQKSILNKIDATKNATIISLGSIVKVNQNYLFISSALPKISVDLKTVIALSPESPLAQKIIGKSIGFEFNLNGSDFKIQEIY